MSGGCRQRAAGQSLAALDSPDSQIDLVRVARSDIAGDLGAFFHIAADDDIGGRRAVAVGLLKAAIAAIEARDHLLAAVSARRFGIDQGLRLAPPFLAFAAVADAAQEMQRPQNFRQPLQVAIIGRRRILRGRLLRRARGLRRRFVCRSMPSMVRRVPTTTPAVAPVIAPELRPRRLGSETKRERNGDAYANGWHGRTIIQTRRNEFDLSQVAAGIFPMMPISIPRLTAA